MTSKMIPKHSAEICKRSFIAAMRSRVDRMAEAKAKAEYQKLLENFEEGSSKEEVPSEESFKQTFKAPFLEPFEADAEDKSAQENLGALGYAVCEILLAKSQTVSSEAEDKLFWSWVQTVDTWIQQQKAWQEKLYARQEKLVKAFDQWQPSSRSDITLKKAILKELEVFPPKGEITPIASLPDSLQSKVQIPDCQLIQPEE